MTAHRIKLWLTIFSVLLFSAVSLEACKPRKATEDPRPELFLSESQMTELITDISLAEAGINYKRNTNKPIDEFKEPIFSVILQKHGVTLKVFEENLNWYNKDPETIERIYDRVLADIESIKSEAAAQKENPDAESGKTE